MSPLIFLTRTTHPTSWVLCVRLRGTEQWVKKVTISLDGAKASQFDRYKDIKLPQPTITRTKKEGI